MDGIIYTQLCQPCILEGYECSRDRVYAHMEKIWLIGVHICPIWHISWLYVAIWACLGYEDRPTKMAPMFSIENIVACRLGLARIGNNRLMISTKCPSFSKLNSLILP